MAAKLKYVSPTVSELDKLKAERQALREQIAELERRRGAVQGASLAVSDARSRLHDFEYDSAQVVKAWFDGGCHGGQPVIDAKKHAELREAVEAVSAAEKAAEPALAEITDRIRSLHVRLHEIVPQIEVAAGREYLAAIAEKAARLKALLKDAGSLKGELNAIAGKFATGSKQDPHVRPRNLHLEFLSQEARNVLAESASYINDNGAAQRISDEWGELLK